MNPLSNWRKLHEHLKDPANGTPAKLKRLYAAEWKGNRRPMILDRLMARYRRACGEKLRQEVQS